MTGRDLLLGLTEVEPEFLAEAENGASPHQRIFHRPVLVAALIALVLVLVGCTYAVLSETEWFEKFFANWQNQELSESQNAFVEEHIKVIGQSVTKDGYTLTVESAIADSYNAYIKLRLTSENGAKLDAESYLPEYRFREDRTWEQHFYALDNPQWRYITGMGPSEEDATVIMLRVNQNERQNAKPLEEGVTYRIHMTRLVGYYSDGSEVVLTEEDFDFDIFFDTLYNETLEMLSEPITASFSDIQVNVTSLRQHRTMGAAGFGGSFAPIVQHEKWEIHPVFPHFSYFHSGKNLSPNLLTPLCGVALKLRALSITTDYNGRTDEKGALCFVDSFVVLKDGTEVSFRPYTFGPEGATCFLTGPVDLEEVDYVRLRDGTKIPVPETEKSPG